MYINGKGSVINNVNLVYIVITCQFCYDNSHQSIHYLGYLCVIDITLGVLANATQGHGGRIGNIPYCPMTSRNT